MTNETPEIRIEEDWTKNCTPKTVDIPAFIKKMEALKSGTDIDWTCPFCGGAVTLFEDRDGHTEIGCDSCDMRICLDVH